jgi:Subtilase family
MRLLYFTANLQPCSKPGVLLLDLAPWRAGTSFSAPQVSGVINLLWNQYPQATALQVLDCVRNTATTQVS